MARGDHDLDDLKDCGFEHIANIERSEDGNYVFRALRQNDWNDGENLYAFVGDDRLLSIGETGESLRKRCQGGGGYEAWFTGRTGQTPKMLALYMAEFQRCRAVKVLSKKPERIDIAYLVQRGIRGLSARKVEEDALNKYFRPVLWKRGRKPHDLAHQQSA